MKTISQKRLAKEVLFLLKRSRKHLVKQWGEDDGFISRLDCAISELIAKETK